MNYNTVFSVFIILIATYFAKNTYVQLVSSENEISQLSFESDNSGFVMQNLNNGTSSVFNSPEGDKILSLNSYKNLHFYSSLFLNSETLDVVMKYSDSKLIYDSMEQWTMFIFDDFQGSAFGWSKEKLSTCGANDNMFLGGHCNFGGEEVSKNYTDLPAHSMLRITANFHFFDKWEGEEAFMLVNDVPVWSDTYTWCDKVFLWKCKKYAINACGAEYPDKLSMPIDFTTMHDTTNFTLTFGAYHNKSACDASWGIDDVTIYIK